MSVALLIEAGFNRSEVARRTGATPDQLRDAWARLERVAHLIDRGDDL